MANVPHLPLELWRQILDEIVRSESFRSVLRLRLVCSAFDSDVAEMLVPRLMDLSQGEGRYLSSRSRRTPSRHFAACTAPGLIKQVFLKGSPDSAKPTVLPSLALLQRCIEIATSASRLPIERAEIRYRLCESFAAVPHLHPRIRGRHLQLLQHPENAAFLGACAIGDNETLQTLLKDSPGLMDFTIRRFRRLCISAAMHNGHASTTALLLSHIRQRARCSSVSDGVVAYHKFSSLDLSLPRDCLSGLCLHDIFDQFQLDFQPSLIYAIQNDRLDLFNMVIERDRIKKPEKDK